MNKLCLLYKQIQDTTHVLISSLSMMIFGAIIFYFLFFSKIKNIEEILYPITAIPLAIYTILTKIEPSFFIVLISVLIWIIIFLSSLWIDNKIICRIQFIYTLISFILACIVMLGKNI